MTAPAPAARPAPEIIAAEVLAALDQGRQIAPFSARAAFDLDTAYAVTAAVRRIRIARGERPVGRKIGFTNRTIWAEYGVYAPIWGDMYDTTVRALTETREFSLARFQEPRIEPEIVFGLSRTPNPGMDEAALLACIEWIAHGFEIVQSIFPDWRFAAADTVAAFGLHGALLVGERHPVGAHAAEWLRELAAFGIRLECDGATVDRGRAENVLGGPLSALRHLVELLARDPHNPSLAAGEIVTTGTLTRAWPIGAGQAWRTALQDLPLEGISVRFR